MFMPRFLRLLRRFPLPEPPILTGMFQCAVKSHGSPVGETKQTHPGTIRSARNHLEG
jgi:hypothetical protein